MEFKGHFGNVHPRNPSVWSFALHNLVDIHDIQSQRSRGGRPGIPADSALQIAFPNFLGPKSVSGAHVLVLLVVAMPVLM